MAAVSPGPDLVSNTPLPSPSQSFNEFLVEESLESVSLLLMALSPVASLRGSAVRCRPLQMVLPNEISFVPVPQVFIVS